MSNKSLRSVPLNVSIPNTPPKVIEGGKAKKSLYSRLCNYSNDKSIKEQAVIRFALSMFLDKVGY